MTASSSDADWWGYAECRRLGTDNGKPDAPAPRRWNRNAGTLLVENLWQPLAQACQTLEHFVSHPPQHLLAHLVAGQLVTRAVPLDVDTRVTFASGERPNRHPECLGDFGS